MGPDIPADTWQSKVPSFTAVPVNAGVGYVAEKEARFVAAVATLVKIATVLGAAGSGSNWRSDLRRDEPRLAIAAALAEGVLRALVVGDLGAAQASARAIVAFTDALVGGVPSERTIEGRGVRAQLRVPSWCCARTRGSGERSERPRPGPPRLPT